MSDERIRSITWRDYKRKTFGEHLPIMGEHYDNIVALDADLGKVTKILVSED